MFFILYNKKQIKQKALALAVTSVMSASFMINNDSVQAMKALKAIGHSIKKAVTQEDKKRIKQQQQLENKIAILMNYKLHGLLPPEEEVTLVSNLKIIKVSGEKVKIFDDDDSEINIVNPLIEATENCIFMGCSDNYSDTLKWIYTHLPQAFTDNSIIKSLFKIIEEGDTNDKYKEESKQKATNMCRALLEYEFDLNKKHTYRINGKTQTLTVLEYAQKADLTEVVKIILNKSGDKQYLLYKAICSGKQEEVEKAISYGANVNELVHGTNSENYNPVTLALMKKNTEMADFLIQNGAKLESTLDIALVIRDESVFNYLIQKGAKLSSNASPIELIFKGFGNQKWNFWTYQNNIEFLEKMIQDERINIIWKEEYHRFFDDNQVYTNKIIRDFYLAHCEEIPSTTLRGICGDEKIPESQKIELAKIFFDKHCDISDDSEPLSEACYYQNYDLAKFLIEHGSPVRTTNMYITYSPLAAVIMRLPYRDVVGEKDINFVKYLVNDCKASLDGAQYHGQDLCFVFQNCFFKDATTKLAYTIQDIVTFLIKKGLNVNAIDRDGNTFLSSCIEKKRKCRQEFTTLGNTLFNLFTKAGAKRYLD